MHIAYLHYLYGQDTARLHVRQFAAAARRLGHRVDVHAMNLAPPPEEAGSPPSVRSRARQFFKHRFSRFLHEPKEILWNARYLARESRLLRASRPDLLLVRDHTLTASCVPVARRLGLPFVLEMNAPAAEAALYLADQYLHLPWISECLEGWKVRAADRVVAVTWALKDHLVHRHRVSEDKISVVPNGADVEIFRPDRPPAPELSDLFADAPVVGFVGSFQKWHGAELLARMAMEVGWARPQVRFLFVGDGPELDRVLKGTSHVSDRILFAGRMPHHRVPSLVAHFDVAVMPDTAFYCSPLKLLEWMAAGKAVVAPRYPALQELIQDGVHGLLFQPGDEQALVETVLRLIDEPRLGKSLGKAAATRAQTLTWEANARGVLAACQASVSSHQRPSTTASWDLGAAEEKR